MPVVKCPVPSCQYQTDDLDAVIVAALLNAHCITHSAPSVAKVDKLKRPTIGLAGTSEEWTYFKTRWENYVDGTKNLRQRVCCSVTGVL